MFVFGKAKSNLPSVTDPRRGVPLKATSSINVGATFGRPPSVSRTLSTAYLIKKSKIRKRTRSSLPSLSDRRRISAIMSSSSVPMELFFPKRDPRRRRKPEEGSRAAVSFAGASLFSSAAVLVSSIGVGSASASMGGASLKALPP